jgi:hypothetical protein
VTGKALTGVLAGLLALAGGSAAVALGGGSGVGVVPKQGRPGDRFLVRFTAPAASGHVGGVNRRYVVTASGPSGGAHCLGTVSVTPQRVKAHARVRVILSPRSMSPRSMNGKWCSGRWNGTVEEYESPICPLGKLCPAFVVITRQVGHFHFRVSAARHVADNVAPTFAGLASASACTPGPQRPGQTTPFNLTWKAATDKVTPQNEIVYDVFEATRSGAENYAKPSWTTGSGATSFKTPGLASHGLFYFVVRARDQAGNQDRNKVERRGLDPCL